MNSQIYFISGLGADHRLFEEQTQTGIPLKIISWKVPLKNESLEAYAKRMAEEITDTSAPIIIGGVSFGGMMAIEISKHIKTEKVILISSVKTHHELPFFIKIWKYIPVYKIFSGNFIKSAGLAGRFIFGKMDKQESKIFTDMVKDSDPSFIKWAIHQIVNWKNSEVPANLIHIHGSKDLMFPVSRIKNPVIQISGGTHIMIKTLSEKINPILLKEINKDKA